MLDYAWLRKWCDFKPVSSHFGLNMTCREEDDEGKKKTKVVIRCLLDWLILIFEVKKCMCILTSRDMGIMNEMMMKKPMEQRCKEWKCRLQLLLGLILAYWLFLQLPSSTGKRTLPRTLFMGLLGRDLVHKGVQWEVRSIFVVVKHYCWHALIVFAVKLRAITRVGNQLNDHK